MKYDTKYRLFIDAFYQVEKILFSPYFPKDF